MVTFAHLGRDSYQATVGIDCRCDCGFRAGRLRRWVVVQTTTTTSAQGPMSVQHITYRTFDGARVPALFAIPRAAPARGCLIWENGFGGTKEGAARLFDGGVRLGLAMFAIDLRDHGQRATSPNERFAALRSPQAWDSLVSGTVNDLKRAVDYLWAQPLCRHNIGYAGLSLGGMIGAVVAAQDPRVRAVALMSVPPTYRSLIEVTNHLCSATRQCGTVLLPGITTHAAQLQAATRLLSPLDPGRWIGKISPRPLLLMFGIHDPLVPPKLARMTTAAARKPVTVVNYDGGHIPLSGSVAASNAEDIERFFLNYLVVPTYGTSLPRLNLLAPGHS